MEHKAQNSNGEAVTPQSGVIPIIKEVSPGVLQTIGTGFYITRYGLIMTAAHVLEDLRDESGQEIVAAYVAHMADEEKVHLRRILSVSISSCADIAIAQVDNYIGKYPEAPLMNMRCQLDFSVPEDGSQLVTYAYPENKVMDFSSPESTPTITSDFYNGEFLRHIVDSQHPHLSTEYYETSVEVKSGASGGPVFCNGSVVGVNCRGWNFLDDGDSLSYIIPVSLAASVQIGNLAIPKGSWEQSKIKFVQDENSASFQELIHAGHIDVSKTT